MIRKLWLGPLGVPLTIGLSAVAGLLLVAGCGSSPSASSDGPVGSVSSRLVTLTMTPATSYAMASGPMASVTVSGGTGTYGANPCTILTNRSGGTVGSCTVSGGVVSYTAGATTGYNIRAQKTNNYLSLVTVATVPYLQTGATASTAEFFTLAGSGAGYTFKANSTGKYVRTFGTQTAPSGNDLIADAAVGLADVYTMVDCNGSGDTGFYNRYAFKSAAGSAPLWQSKATATAYVDSGSNGGTACSVTSTTAPEAFYLDPGIDILKITDSGGNTGTINVSVQAGISFWPTSVTTNSSTAISTVQARGGSGAFTGGSASCTVTGASGGTTCTVTGAGAVSYTPGAAGGTDVVKVTDSQGHNATFNVTVYGPLSLTSSPSYALASSAMNPVTVSGGSGPGNYSCVVASNTSGGSTCSVSAGGVVSYTPGATKGYNILAQRGPAYLSLVTSAGVPYLQPGANISPAVSPAVSPPPTAPSTAALFNISPSGSGYVFKDIASGNYLRNGGVGTAAGSYLVTDVSTLASAGVYAMQDCNSAAGDGTLTNRFGFESILGSSPSGTNPYWKLQGPPNYVESYNFGNGSACSATSTTAYEAFYLYPGTDTLTISDNVGHSTALVVSVESPISFAPASSTITTSTAITPVQTWGGSGIFNVAPAACTVTTNASGGGACTVSGTGLVNYTPGATAGTDVIRVTDSQGHTGTFNLTVYVPFTASTATSHALASSPMSSVTVSGGIGSYTCAVSSSTSGGSTCSVTGGVVSYTAGATAGYNIKSQRTSDYLRLVTNAGVPYVQTGGALGSSADLFIEGATASGFTFKANSSGNYVRNGGNLSTPMGSNLIADVAAAASAATYTKQDCNGTGDPGLYNRFGFQSSSGANPYWKAQTPTVDAVGNGNGSACSPTSPTAYEAFYFNPGTDTLTVTDSGGNTTTVKVSVEPALSVWPLTFAIAASTSLPLTTHAWGGSGIFVGGAAACTVTTNASAGPGVCSITGSGWISYTAGAMGGTDVIKVTDSEGHTKSFNVVVVVGTVSTVTLTPVQPPLQVPPLSSSLLNVISGGPYTWTLSTNKSGATINSSSGVYVAGATPSVADVVTVSDGLGNTGTIIIRVGPPVAISPSPANVKPSTSKTFTASGGSGTGYSWSITGNASGGSINSSTGVYTAGATPGTDTVTVTDSVGNSSSVTITVLCGADNSLSILYPYNGTVFPLGMLPPLVQWSDNGTATAAKVTLIYPATGTPIFKWSEIVSENGPLTSPYDKLPSALPVTGGGRAQIPSLVWTTFTNAAAGQDATIQVQTLESGKGTLASSIKVHFATEKLKGTIYYQSYDSSLVATSPPSGATLAIQVGNAVPTVVDGNNTCRDCHSVSADGSRLVTADGSVMSPALYASADTVSLASNTETTIAANNDGRFAWPALSPDGSMAFTNSGNAPNAMSGQQAASIYTQLSGLYSMPSGAPLATSGLPSGLQAKFPTFAPDTSALAFNYNDYDGKTLAMMKVANTAGTWTFSGLKLLFIPPAPPLTATYTLGSGMATWPSFMPTGQGGIVVQNQIRYNCNEGGADGSGLFGTGLQHNIGAQGELWWVNTTGTPIPTPLDRANGVGYLPTGPNGHGVAGTTIPSAAADPIDTAGGTPSAAQMVAAGAGTCRTDLRNAIGNGDDTKLNFKPTVNPKVTGGYQWVVFTSRRLYGNVATLNPYASDQRFTDEISASKAMMAGYALQPTTKKLWVAAVNTSPTAGTDPSYPAFYLDGQELYAGNSRSYWVLPQCVAPSVTPTAANLCTTNSDCCQTTPSTCALDIPIAADPAIAHCVPNTSIMCSVDNGPCNVDGDCCSLIAEGTRCSGNVCTVPHGSGYPNSVSIDYDFQATCTTDGTHAVWQLLRSTQLIPADTSIGFAVRSATTQAGLASATMVTEGTATVSVSDPQYLTGASTVDQLLQAATPTSVSADWLRVTVTLNPSSDHLSTPSLTSLTPTYDCLYDQ